MLRQWSGLLKAVRRTEGDLDGITPFREALEGAYAEALSNRAVQGAMRSSAKESTRRLNESFGAGSDAAISLRNFIKSVLGSRSEKLRLYGMKPRRGSRGPNRRPAIGFKPSA